MKRYALIIGAGPAGLTAAYELLTRSDIVPIVLEKSQYMGGISRTVNYKGNRIDIGGHRFFSKSDRVMQWWLKFLPVAEGEAQAEISYQQSRRRLPEAPAARMAAADHPASDSADRVMLVRNRKSRIYFLRKFFDYPIRLSGDTVRKLGLVRVAAIGLSYLHSVLRPIKPEQNLEQFFINRFGRVLYRLFFQSYTEKVWGVPCDQISAEWGAQRIKGLSILKTLKHACGKLFRRGSNESAKAHAAQHDISQKSTETSLIERFLYPKLGPGQMWETVAEEVLALGGQIVTGAEVRRLYVQDDRVTHVEIADAAGNTVLYEGQFVFSTMPVSELVRALDPPPPANVRQVAAGLIYRDFITVGLLLDKLAIAAGNSRGQKLIDDNWIYIQEPDVQVGRLQIFNNWSPALVADPDKVWVGMEYFCYETDELWRKPDGKMIELAVGELEKIGIIRSQDVRDATVIRMPKTYPAYFGAYDRFGEIRQYVDGLENLFLVGRNGMHKYNNQDHSMLTAMVAVDNILAGRVDKSNIWAVNTEQEYHEESDAAQSQTGSASHPAAPSGLKGQGRESYARHWRRCRLRRLKPCAALLRSAARARAASGARSSVGRVRPRSAPLARPRGHACRRHAHLRAAGLALLASREFTRQGLPELVRTPGYPLLLSLGIALGHVELVTVLLQIALGVATVWLAHRLTELVGGSRAAALAAAGFLAIDPLSIGYCCYLMPETLFTFLLVLGIVCLLEYLRSERLGQLLAGGGLVAAAALVRPVGYYLAPALVVCLIGRVILVNEHRARRRSRPRCLPRSAWPRWPVGSSAIKP